VVTASLLIIRIRLQLPYMANEHILVVDDEPDILELVRYNLVKDGFQVSTAQSGEECLELISKKLPDLVLLDLMLPGIDGLEVTRCLRREVRTAKLPVVILTAKGEENDVVAGLEIGADDYVPKPFSPKVLSARVKSVLRRRAANLLLPPESASLTVDSVTIDPARREASVEGKLIELTNLEFKLLSMFLRNTGLVFTREQIVKTLHGVDYPVTDRSIDVVIVGLRRKLGERGKLIETVRSVGYRWKD